MQCGDLCRFGEGNSAKCSSILQNYSNWRGDSEKRFKFDGEFFTSTVAWGVLPFTLYYFVAADERVSPLFFWMWGACWSL